MQAPGVAKKAGGSARSRPFVHGQVLTTVELCDEALSQQEEQVEKYKSQVFSSREELGRAQEQVSARETDLAKAKEVTRIIQRTRRELVAQAEQERRARKAELTAAEAKAKQVKENTQVKATKGSERQVKQGKARGTAAAQQATSSSNRQVQPGDSDLQAANPTTDSQFVQLQAQIETQARFIEQLIASTQGPKAQEVVFSRRSVWANQYISVL